MSWIYFYKIFILCHLLVGTFAQVDKQKNALVGCGGKCSDEFPISPNMNKNCNIAGKAADDARAAVEAQVTAADEAAKQAKLLLADRALMAAKRADQASERKQKSIERLLGELKCEQKIIHEETARFNQICESIECAASVLKASRERCGKLSNDIRLAELVLKQSEKFYIGTQRLYEESVRMADNVKKRKESLLQKLNEARADYEKTKCFAHKAALAAKKATDNANRM